MSAMTTSVSRDLGRLAERAQARRRELALPLATAAQAAGMSKDTFRRVERGLPIRDSSYSKIDTALRWAVGSCIATLNGEGDPIGIQATPIAGIQIATLTDAQVKDVVSHVAIAVTNNLTAREIRDLSEQVLAELRKRGMEGT